MKLTLSQQTIEILNNLSKINSNIYIEPGNLLHVYKKEDGIYGGYKCEETFESPMGIYDLREFLNVLNLHKLNEIEIKDKYCLIKGEKARTKYVFNDPIVLEYPKHEPKINEFEVEFGVLDWEALSEMFNAASILGLEYAAFVGDGHNIFLVLEDIETPNNNNYMRDLDVKNDKKFKFIVPVSNLKKLMKGKYNIHLSSKKILKLVNIELPLVYYITMHKDSSYEG